MTFSTNQKVKTPYGPGTVDGTYVILDGNGNVIVIGIGVRLKVDKQTEPNLKASNCVTPLAKISGLWVFPSSEVTA